MSIGRYPFRKNIDSVALDTGLQVVKLAFITGSWNFDWMQFTLKSATPVLSGAKNGSMQKGFDIKPVINGNNVAVSFSLTQTGLTTVSVFDCAGRTMAPAIVRNLNAGSQKQIIGKGNMGRGIYFIRIEQYGMQSVSPFSIQ